MHPPLNHLLLFPPKPQFFLSHFGEQVSASAQDGLVCQAKVVVSHQGQS